MTLQAMLDTHDEGALSALASVGLVRRAGRDLEAGKAQIEARDETEATVVADGQTVTIGPELSAGSCTCPATGICRHMLLAVLALRAEAPSAGAEAAPIAPARDDLAAMSEADLKKFAGADWDKAITQATISTEATISEEGANLSVLLPDTDHPVVFLAGLGPKGAVYKGPKTTKRRVVTAAALVARMQGGTQALDQLTRNDESTDATLSGDFLVRVKVAIEAMLGAVFSGGSIVAEEQLFDLSISARAQAAPRLTALLRILVRHARYARDSHFAYTDDQFLSDAAFAYALATALENNPGDPALTGVLRRHYASTGALELFMVGAVKWHTPGGARGTRLYGFNPESGSWYSTGQARGSGMDTSFAPENVYHAPLWGQGTASSLIGTGLVLNDARVSSDNQIAWDHGRGTALSQKSALEALRQTGAVFSNWAEAKADLARRAPSGLRRVGAALPVMLAPKEVGQARFDDIAQLYRMRLVDAYGQGLDLTIPAARVDDMAWLWQNKVAIEAMFCEVSVAGLGLQVAPMTVYLKTPKGPKLCNLTLDRGQRRFDVGAKAFGDRAWSFLKVSFSKGDVSETTVSALNAVCVAALDAAAETLRFGTCSKLEDLVRRADELGLEHVARALGDLKISPTPANGLRVSYLASESIRLEAMAG